jgi:hypothetical protein
MLKLMVRQKLLIMIKIIQMNIDQKPKGGIRYSMKPFGLTEWLLMELRRHPLMSWFMDIMLFCHVRCNQTQGE